MRRSTVKLNKPIQHGVAVLDRAKLPMYAWHYEYMIPKYGEKAEVGYTDTDSFIYEIETEDVYEDIRADVSTMFDTCAFRRSSFGVTENEQEGSGTHER